MLAQQQIPPFSSYAKLYDLIIPQDNMLRRLNDLIDFSLLMTEYSRTDMSFKYFLDLSPKSDVINPSSLTKFRKLRLKDTHLLNLLIGKTVSIAIDKGVIKSKPIIVDATHTESKSNPLSPI